MKRLLSGDSLLLPGPAFAALASVILTSSANATVQVNKLVDKVDTGTLPRGIQLPWEIAGKKLSLKKYQLYSLLVSLAPVLDTDLIAVNLGAAIST
ncbi:hypothetical protein RUND412_004816 [Rhizina undulata]